MKRLLRTLWSLGIGLLPLWGALTDNWSDSTGLLLYWCETLLVIPLTALQIALHRRWTHKRGHGYSLTFPSLVAGQERPGPRFYRHGQFLSDFVQTSLLATVFHGLFLGVLPLVMSKQLGAAALEELEGIRAGLSSTAALLLLGFAWDLVSLAQRPFRWLRDETDAVMGRAGMVHFALLIGVFSMVFTKNPQSLFYAYAVLRLAGELCALVQYKESGEAPRWLVSVLDRIQRKDSSFADFWRENHSLKEKWRSEEEEIGEPEGQTAAASARSSTPRRPNKRRSSRSRPGLPAGTHCPR